MSAREKYADIIDKERPASKRHPRMPLCERAAQFGSFAALRGYDTAVKEVVRESEENANIVYGFQEEMP